MMYFLVAIISYFIGTVSGAFLVSKLYNVEDVVNKGSGNRGATNVFRNYGFKLFLVTGIIDIIKGILATYIAYKIGPVNSIYISGVFVVLGHIYPIYYGFKGGKGVATSFGVTLMHIPILGIIEIILFLVLNKILKIVSSSSIIVMIFGVVYTAIFHFSNKYLFIMIVINAIIVIIAHRSNIQRLINKSEVKTELLKG